MTEQHPPQQPYGQQQPQPGYYTPPQPKKKHTARNILIVMGVLFVVFVGGCVAVVGMVGNEVSDAIDESEAKDKEPGGPDNPMDITEGQAFEVSGFNYQKGWTIKPNTFGWDVVKLRVENNRDDKDSALVEIKLWKGQEVLALADCTSEPIAVGTITRLTCTTADDFPKGYDRITINDTF